MIAPGWRLPDPPLRASAFTSNLIGLVAGAALACAARIAMPLSDQYAFKAAALLLSIMVFSIGFLQPHHPFDRFGAANQVTTLRAILVSLVAALIGEAPQPAIAAAAAATSAAATLLDGADGWLARRAGLASRFGARFDMEVDALLILALSILVWRHGKAGAWVVASGLLRYAFVAAGLAAPWLRGSLPPNRRRQTICVIQIAALTLATLPAIEPPASTLLAATALAALTCSFLIDSMWLWRHQA